MVIPVDGAAEDSPEVTTYNEVQKRARSSIDQTFGILKGRWRCLLGARQLLCEPETAPGECWAHGPSRSRARRCRRATPRPQPPPAPPPPPPTLCSAQGRTVTDSYAI
ncbi:uncharacterized protein isoform X3 [Choristoneura fumiferana]|uniref:uncharacterized protein isoform X3 n=1 Tax=Choristoneura fumiferana TaxID=7141 RepID=UPI003D158798